MFICHPVGLSNFKSAHHKRTKKFSMNGDLLEAIPNSVRKCDLNAAFDNSFNLQQH